MAMFSRCVPKESPRRGPPRGEMKEMLRRKARELFALCDEEGKGFASKRDMYKLTSELSLAPEQLDEVFETLDQDKNGCITVDEFTEGLGMFLGLDCHIFQEEEESIDRYFEEGSSAAKGRDDDDEQFEEFLDHLGANNVFKDEDYIRHMWEKVKQDDPMMLDNFEKFLGKITQELKTTKNDYSTLESALRSRSIDHEEQVQALYTEMENQLQSEMEMLLAKERSKEQRIRNELATELQHKDSQLQELMMEHDEMEKQLDELNALDAETRQQNSMLQKERDELALSLSASEKMLKDMQSRLELLRKRSLEEKRKRAKAAFKVSENIALEREGLVKQLLNLKKVNKQLIDEKDELLLSASNTPINISDEDSPPGETIDKNVLQPSPRGKIINSKNSLRPAGTESPRLSPRSLSRASPSQPSQILHQMHRVPTYEDPLMVQERCNSEIPAILEDGKEDLHLHSTSSSCEAITKSEDECEVDDHYFINDPQFIGLPEKDRLLLQNNLNVSSCKNDFTSTKMYSENKGNLTKNQLVACEENSNSNSNFQALDHSPNTRRKLDLENQKDGVLSPPERVFKIVLIGDSGVGKTSLVRRFCNDSFKATFNATVGVDFQVQTVSVEGRSVVLQLWDTAGQERFRSITQQYYRKADGIIVVYDVTSETSFKNVRNWMIHVQDNADENVVLMLIGNKIDLCDNDESRVVKTKHGSRLADEYGTLFYETSAKNGSSVEESMAALACLLQQKEDEVMDKVLHLREDKKTKKKSCC